MTEYLSGKEQMGIIKKWWHNWSGCAIAINVVVRLLIVFWWWYWYRHQIEKIECASQRYTELQVMML